MPKKKRKIASTPKAIELFAGAGGLGMGISLAGFDTKAVIEYDRYCCDTIRENQQAKHPLIVNWPLFEADVHTIDFRKHSGIDLVSGGPPCQPFSLGGKHKAYLDRRDLFPEAVRAVREVMPRAFIFENVKGLTRQAFTNYYEYIFLQLSYPDVTRKTDEDWTEHHARLEQHHTSKRAAKGLSYRVVRRLLNAADYGVPQKRERVFFVGVRSDIELEWNFPEATHSLDSLIWHQVNSGDYWDAHKVAKKNNVVPDKFRSRAKRLKEAPRSLAWRTVRDAIADIPDPRTLSGCFLTNHRFQPGARSYPGHTGSPLDEPAKTLKAGVHGVPGGENMLALKGGEVRYFTVRESARLQTFPDDFVFHGAWGETMRQLGNAVPVALARVVAQSVRNHLERAAGAPTI